MADSDGGVLPTVTITVLSIDADKAAAAGAVGHSSDSGNIRSFGSRAVGNNTEGVAGAGGKTGDGVAGGGDTTGDNRTGAAINTIGSASVVVVAPADRYAGSTYAINSEVGNSHTRRNISDGKGIVLSNAP